MSDPIIRYHEEQPPINHPLPRFSEEDIVKHKEMGKGTVERVSWSTCGQAFRGWIFFIRFSGSKGSFTNYCTWINEDELVKG